MYHLLCHNTGLEALNSLDPLGAFLRFHLEELLNYLGVVQWTKVAIVGIGLLGGSIGLALKKLGIASKVSGYVRRKASIEECRGVADEVSQDLPGVVEGADLTILCTPVSQMRALLEQMISKIARGSIVTDVGSVKGVLVRELEPLAKSVGAHYIGSHPMAGAEKTGVNAARADLFAGAICVVTPSRFSEPEQVERVEQFWTSLGGLPMRLSPDLHDELVSRSSHLPHVLAALLADFVLNPDHPREQPRLCANGFRDTTRIASGSPEMWKDICLANRDNLGRALSVFGERLQEFRRILDNRDAGAIEEWFVRAKARRDQWRSGSTSGD